MLRGDALQRETQDDMGNVLILSRKGLIEGCIKVQGSAMHDTKVKSGSMAERTEEKEVYALERPEPATPTPPNKRIDACQTLRPTSQDASNFLRRSAGPKRQGLITQ